MILLDTNILIYASTEDSTYRKWCGETIAQAVSADGGAISAVSLAEICVGEEDPNTAEERIRGWGVSILDIPAAAAQICAAAYKLYRGRRRSQSGLDSPRIPLPDFFIGAHAQIMGWELATVDENRYRTYFPFVALVTPWEGYND